MRCGTKRLNGLALGLLAILVASQAAPLRADLVPVGYWALNDSQTDPYTLTAVDSSANGNNGTLVNFPSTPTWGTGAFGGALKFDGVNDSVDMSAPTALDISGALSTSVWMGRLGPNGSAYAPLLGKNESGGSTNDAYYVSSKSDSHIVFGITPAVGTPVELTSSAAVLNGTWHNVVTTFDPGNRMAIYLDGVLDSELTTGVPMEIRQVTTPFRVGNLSGTASSTYSFNGYLDEVNVFNGVLGLTQIQSLAAPPSVVPGDPTPSALVAHWKLDDGQADPNTTTAVDSTVPASNGTLVNFDTPPSWDTGKIGGALRIDGTNDRVDVGTTAELDITGDLSMAFWMKPNGTGAMKYGALVGKNMSGGPASDAYFTDFVYTASVTGATVPAGTIEFAITNGDLNYVVRSATALSRTDDTWHHVAVTYDDGSRMAIYIDGVLNSELTIDVPGACDLESFTPFALGNLAAGSSTNAYCYKGFLDDVRVYTGVLTAAEIADLAGVVDVPGDATGNGVVDELDARALAANWGASGPTVTWAMGDFDGDDLVGPRDASIMAANWGYGSSEATAVPEPTALMLLVGGLVGLLMRRDRSERGKA
jgi:hypothetical protein